MSGFQSCARRREKKENNFSLNSLFNAVSEFARLVNKLSDIETQYVTFIEKWLV